MVNGTRFGESEALTNAQQTCRQEWRNLCFTVERFQADGLISECRNRYQFARTYLNYGRDLEGRMSDLKEKAIQGNYSFFTERGVPADIMSPQLVGRLLRDWKGAIASKMTRVAEAFEIRFGEEIGVFIATARNTTPLMSAESLDDADAVIQLGRWTRG